ncbi:hypothetical protein B0H94_105118 [Salsuginibacillus halophilus]|uniref:Uncharacterized protein n=1 Tax=Salsuginibacillus halophilus TaxID=517424 RepID=A0A2P8HL68_9BACI|nr:hypothetical protein B0H94_105118 [Salsuginibacillus halophilus]
MGKFFKGCLTVFVAFIALGVIVALFTGGGEDDVASDT